jgi:peroxiredoxin 2/4
MVIGRAYGMVCAQDQDSAAVRTTFFIDPNGIIRATTCYPANLGRSVPEMLRMLDGLQAIDAHGALAPANWQQGQALLRQPTQDLDEVYAAGDAAEWFMRDMSKTG